MIQLSYHHNSNYSEELYPPMSLEEYKFFAEVLRENWQLYINQPYLRYYWGYEYVRLIMELNPSILDRSNI